MTTTKQPSAAAMEAAREMMPLVKGVFLPASQYGAGQVLAAIIDRHLSAERQEVREFVGILLGWMDIHGDSMDYNSWKARAESLLARMGGE